MTIPKIFKFNEDAYIRPGGVFEPNHNFSLVNQNIFINKNDSFSVRFPNIWESYKLPQITDKEVYDKWLSNQMQFWQNQLNFAVWCATTASGISKEHLTHRDPMIKSFFRFHAYYQIRRILSEMNCPLPNQRSFNPLNNDIDKNAFERICAEFGVNPRENFRQYFDPLNGMGFAFYYSTHTEYHKMTSKKVKTLEKTGSFDLDNFTVEVRGPLEFGKNNRHVYRIEYIEQTFHKESGYVDGSPDGTQMSSISSFVADYSNGFTQAGVSRINDSIRVYTWGILGAQAQTKSSILGVGKAFDTQKQFLANVEDAIESEIDLPSSIDRYQSTLQYARSKVDFVLGLGLYMIPSDMDLHVGTINGYNNLIVIASEKLQLGKNTEVNEETVQNLEVNDEFQSVVDNLQDDFQEDLKTQIIDENNQIDVQNLERVDNLKDDFQDGVDLKKQIILVDENNQITHEDRKLLLILGGATLGSFAIWWFR